MSALTAVVEARHVRGHVVWLRFSDGTDGEVDLADELHGEGFEPLKSVAEFARVQLDPELHTIAWPNGADFAPEFLHGRVRSQRSGRSEVRTRSRNSTAWC